MTIEEDAMIVVAGTTAEAVMTGAPEMTVEVVMIIVDVTTAEVVMTIGTVVETFQTTIGIVRSVIIPTLHSEQNVIAVASQKETEVQINVMTVISLFSIKTI